MRRRLTCTLGLAAALVLAAAPAATRAAPTWLTDVPIGTGDTAAIVMNADGSNRMQLTDDARQDVGPTWPPDGRMIAFTRSLTLDDPGDVWVMNADGSSQRALTSTDVIEESPDWQPIPALAGVRGSRTACGDLSLDPGGVASAFVARDPATASAPSLAPTPTQGADQPPEAEALPDDDALPRPEEE